MGKRIVIFIPKLYHGGGAERSSLALGQALKTEHEIFFVTQHTGDINTSPAGAIYSWQQSENSISKFKDMIPSAYKLKEFCETHKIDMVIANMPRANTITILAKLLGNKTKNILVTRNANTGNKLHGLILPLYNLAEKNIAVSRGTEFVLQQVGIKNTQTIYNPFDFDVMNKKFSEDVLPEHEELFKNGTIFFTVGRLHKQKGYLYLLDAFKKLLEQKPESKLLIAGEGSERGNLELVIKLFGLEKKVYLLGNIQNIFPYLKHADAFVFASLWEGLPTVLIEALFTKTPIITTDCMSGPREILTDKPYSQKLLYPYRAGDNTLIVPPDVSEADFTNQFVDAALRINKKTKQETQTLLRFSLETVSREWNDLIAKL